jgi:hypothetical protein
MENEKIAIQIEIEIEIGNVRMKNANETATGNATEIPMQNESANAMARESESESESENVETEIENANETESGNVCGRGVCRGSYFWIGHDASGGEWGGGGGEEVAVADGVVVENVSMAPSYGGVEIAFHACLPNKLCLSTVWAICEVGEQTPPSQPGHQFGHCPSL